MNYIQFRNAFRDFPVFSTSDIRMAFEDFDRRRLSEWQKKGYIIKVVKGHYVFTDVDIDETTLSVIANKIYKPSYISFETAMSHHGLIPESVYMITSASTRRTYRFETPVARYSYRSIKPELFFGYDILPNSIKMACMEKAVLDYLYINPAFQTVDDYTSLRINREELLSRLNEERFAAYVSRFDHKRLAGRTKHLMHWIRYA